MLHIKRERLNYGLIHCLIYLGFIENNKNPKMSTSSIALWATIFIATAIVQR